MSFYIAHRGPRGLYLRRSSGQWSLSPLGLLLGGGAILAGMVLWRQGYPYSWAVAGAGLVLALGPTLILNAGRAQEPTGVVFDDMSSCVVWLSGGRGQGEAFVPYRELKGVGYRQRSSLSSSSPGWEVVLHTERGGSLNLASFSTEQDAQALASAIRPHLSHGGGPIQAPYTWPPKMRHQLTNEGSTLRWRDTPGALPFILVLLFFGVWFGLLSFFDSQAPADVAPIPVTHLMRAVGLLVLVGILRSLWQGQTSHTLSISRSELSYLQGDQPKWAIPLSKVSHIFVDWERYGLVRVGDTSQPEDIAPSTQVDTNTLEHLRTLLQPRGNTLDVAFWPMIHQINFANGLGHEVEQLRAGRSPSLPAPSPPEGWWGEIRTGGFDAGLGYRLVGMALILVSPGEWLLLMGSILAPSGLEKSGPLFIGGMRMVLFARLGLGMVASRRLSAVGDTVWGILVVAAPLAQVAALVMGEVSYISATTLIAMGVGVVGGIRLLQRV